MLKNIKFVAATMFMCVIALGSKAQTSVTINPNNRQQTVEGWGVSLCWWAKEAGQWAKEAGQWDDAKINEIADWLVSPDGLNYNVFRYNIPGGDAPGHDHMSVAKGGKGLRAEMKGFLPNKDDWNYDWSADEAQIKMLRAIVAKAKEYGKEDILKIEAFSNSCPWWMTVSGCVSGSKKTGSKYSYQDTNLKSDYYDDFARYLVEVCQHFKDVEGIEFYSLEPFNEPMSNNDWYTGGVQEGCYFKKADQIDFVKNYLAPELAKDKYSLNTIISVSDETNLGRGKDTFNSYKNDKNVMNCFAQWNVHTYDGSDQERKDMRDLVMAQGKRLWMSETGPSGNDEGLTSNLGLAQKMFNDLRILQPVVWCDWQAMETNKEWCLLTCGGDNDKYTLPIYRNKNYFVRSQVNSNIKVGYTILKTDNQNILAAINPNGTEVVVCFLNTDDKSGANYNLNVSAMSDLQIKKATITDGTHDCAEYNISSLSNISVPAQSIVTVVIEGNYSLKMTDSDGHDLVFGGKYMISTTKKEGSWPSTKYPDFYFYASDDNALVSSQRNFPSTESSGFYSSQYIWKPVLAGPNKIKLKNMKHMKFLAGSSTPNLSTYEQERAMTFSPSGPYEKHDGTPNFWVLDGDTGDSYRYLNWNGGTEGNGFCYWTVGEYNVGSNFRFHKMEYVHINAYVQKNGMLEPVEFKLNNNNDLVYTGEAELYHNQTILGKVTSFALTQSVNDVKETKYILNGEKQTSSVDVKNLKDGDWLTIVYVVGDTEEVNTFYKIKSGEKYLSAKESGLTLADNEDDDVIFYHNVGEKGSSLLSFTKGVYLKENSLSTIEDNNGSQILFVCDEADINGDEEDIKVSAIMVNDKYLTYDYKRAISLSSKTSNAYYLEPVKALPVQLHEIGGKGYATFYAPVDVTVSDGLEAYTAELEGDVLYLKKVDGVIPAATGVILYTETATMDYALQIDDVSVSADTDLDGTYPRKYVDGNIYGLNEKNGKVGFYKMKSNSKLSPFRAFLRMPEDGEAKELSFDFSETDIVEAIEMWHQENAIYDLQGRKVQNPGTGLYIVNGKKILIRK